MRHTTATAELELADRARAGDQVALIQLYKKHRDAIYRHARRMLGDDAAAQDVVQEAFARAMEAIDRTRPQLKFKAWVFRIATNLCLRELNRHSRLRPPRAERFDFDRLEQPRADADPRAVQRRREIGELVEQALSRLPERYRQILLLREVEELSYEELGQVLEMSEGNVKVTLHRARARFAALFVADRLLADPSSSTGVACGQLDGLVREGVDQDQVERHLESCAECRGKQRPPAELFALLPPVAPVSPLPEAPRPASTSSGSSTGTGGAGLASSGLSGAAVWGFVAAAGVLVLGIAVAAGTILTRTSAPLQATESSAIVPTSTRQGSAPEHEPVATPESSSPSPKKAAPNLDAAKPGRQRATSKSTSSPRSKSKSRSSRAPASKRVHIQATDEEDPPRVPPTP